MAAEAYINLSSSKMPNKVLLTILVTILSILGLTAQQRTITVVSDADGSPAGDAYVLVHSLTSEGKKYSVLTNEDGVANIKYTGPVFIEISHASFVPHSDTLKAGESQYYRLIPLNIQVPEVVVTGQFTPEDPKRSVYAIKVIDVKTIERRGATNLRELLSQELNMRVTQDNVLGSGLSLQGLSGEQVKYMIDGVPILGRLNGDIDISQINLNDVERVEVIEGPVSVQYGTNALGGVINIITKTDQGDKINTSVNSYYESRGTYNFDAMAGFRVKNHFFGASMGRWFFDGYDQDKTRRDVAWNPKEQYFGNIKYGLTFKRMRLMYSTNIFNEKITNRGAPRAPFNVNAFDDYYYTFRNANSLTLSGEIIKNHYLNQVIAYSFFRRKKNTVFKDLTDLSETPAADPSLHDTTTFNAFLARGFISRNKIDRKLNYQIGYDINIETASGKRIESGSQSIGDYAGFGSVSYAPFNWLTIQPGLRYSYNSAYRAPVTPSLHIKMNPAEHLIVRMSYARGFRAPSIKELYFDFYDINHNIYGNLDLEAEYSNNVNLQVSYNKPFKQHHLIKVTPTLYFNDIKNDIELIQDFSGGDEGNVLPYTYGNLSSNRIVGYNFIVQYTLKENFSIGFSTAMNGRNYQFNDTLSSDGFKWSPEVSANANYVIPKAKLRLTVYYKYNGQFITPYIESDGSVAEQIINPYGLLDFSVGRSFWKNRVVVNVGAKNLLDINQVNTNGGSGGGAHSVGATSVPIAWGRSYFVSLKLQFSKS